MSIRNFIATTTLMLVTSIVYAVEPTQLYNISLTDTAGTFNVSARSAIGSVSPIKITQLDETKSTNCTMNIKDAGNINLAVTELNDTGINAAIYPISKTEDTLKLMLVFSKREDFSAEKAVKVNDTCVFANNVFTLTNVNWMGDVKLGEKTLIKLSKDNEFIISAEEIKETK